MTLTSGSRLKALPALLALLGLFVFCSTAMARVEVDPFPEYEVLRPNVAFWKQVYAVYPSTKALIHDKENLAIVYQVIDLVERDRPGARRLNRQRVKKAKAKYRTILKKLAAGKPAVTPEEQRVLALFAPPDRRKALAQAAHTIRSQTCLKDRFARGLRRSGAYLEEIKKIFKDHGLPGDLAYLPHVESSFNYQAYSKFGAAGIWQFTRSTGKRFMIVNYTLDERRDPIRASHAAARYLKDNYQLLKTWPLAITSYNHGEAGMQRALKKKGSYQTIFKEYNGGYFKFASRNFYAEFLAAREVAKNYRKYFGELIFDPPVKSREVELLGYVAIKDLTEHFEVEIDTLKRFNPALRNPVYAGQKYVPKGYHLRLPTVGSDSKADRVAAIPASLYKPAQKRSLFYRVQRGDTAGQIAENNRVRLGDLILANQLDRRATIYMGQNLRIPVPGEALVVASTSPEKISRPGRVQKDAGPAAGLNKQVLPQQPVATPARTLVALAQPTKVRLPDSQPVKPSLPEAVETGSGESINPAVVIGDLRVEQVAAAEGRYGIIRVEAGETLGHYADWFKIPTRQIRQLNRYPFGRSIRTGQVLKIPLNGKVGKQAFEEQRYEYHKEIEEDFYAAFRIEKIQAYRVKSGDNIWTLCQHTFELPFWLIKKYNGAVDLNALKLSQELLIPVVEGVG